MSLTWFKAGGALTADDTAVYIERKADQEALMHLRIMDYLLLIEPRQQGKTSLVNRLMGQLTLSESLLAYVDVTTPNRSSETAWYQTLCERILRQLKFIPPDKRPTIPQNSYQWRGFLSDIATMALNANRRIIIALDEIGAVNFPGATEFFSVLRDIFNSRQSENEFKQITFMLVGAFHPRDLIADDRISPFNIAQRIRLQDFEQWQVDDLVLKLNLSHPLKSEKELTAQIREVSDRIFYWTNAQPYLTQWLCRFLASRGPKISADDVDRGVEQLRREDENHLPPLLERLSSDASLREYIARIRGGERIKFYPREHRRQAQLELLGVIKADEQGYCRVRNRIYELALQQSFSEQETYQPASALITRPSAAVIPDYRAALDKYEGKRIVANYPDAPPQFFVYKRQLCYLSPEASALLDELDIGYEHVIAEDEPILGLSELRGVTIGSSNHMASILREMRPDLFSLRQSRHDSSPKYVVNIGQAVAPVIGDEATVQQTFGASAAQVSDMLWQRMEAHLAEIAGAVHIGFEDLKRGQAAIYKQIGQAYQEPLAKILDLVQSGRLEQGEMDRTLDAIRRALRAAQAGDVQFHSELREAIAGLHSAVDSKLGLQQKLELTLPIIPEFLAYKVELAAGSDLDLKALREELAQRWQAMLGKLR